jgi:parallel beta-helix repeat protein
MSKTALTLLLISGLVFSAIGGAFLLKSVFGIIIDTDGSITPSTASIFVSGNTYYFTETINGTLEIRGTNNIVIDGNGFTLQGPGGMGIWLNSVHNVTITNLTIQGFFQSALYLTNSCNNSIYNNNLNSNGYCGVELEHASNDNNIFGNNITNNYFAGIRLGNNSPIPSSGSGSDFNRIYDNNISINEHYGVFITNSSSNTIHHNYVLNNSYAGMGLASSANNQFYLNVVVGNSPNAQVGGFVPAWIDSYPGMGGPGANTWDNGSVGNYWSDYALRYPNASQIDASGIGDSPYIIDANNTDRYPLMVSSPVQPTIPAVPTTSTISPDAKKENGLTPLVIVAGAVGASAAIIGVGLFYHFRKRHH